MEELTKELALVKGDILALEATISERIADFNKSLIALREKDIDIRSQITKAMENHDVKKFENEYVSISYTAPTTRKTFDAKTFKEDHPTVYNDYVKISDVKASIRINVKENK